MSVATIRTQITLDANNAQVALEKLSRSVGDFSKSLGGTKNGLNSISNSIKSTNNDILTLTKSIAMVEGSLRAFERFSGAIGTVFKGAYDYTTILESNAVGMSGILASMTKLNGKQLEWNQAMGISRDIMKELRETSLQTASTAPELIDTFRALLGPGMGTGMNVKQIMELTTVGVNAVKSMGLNGTQLAQELRSIVQGNIRASSSTLATALGISNTDVKQAIASSDGLFKFLMERLKGFKLSVDATSNTIKGRIDILQEALYQSIEKTSQNVFNTIKSSLTDLTNIIMQQNEETGRLELNPKFLKQFEKVSNFVNDILSTIGSFGGKLLQNISGLTDAFVMFLKVEGFIASFGMLVVGAGKFRNLMLSINQMLAETVDYGYKLFKNEKSVVEIENEILENIKQRNKVTQDIDKYNKSVLKTVRDEIKERQKVLDIQIQEKQLARNNKQATNTFFAKGNVSVLNSINELRYIGQKMNMSKRDIEKWVSDFIDVYRKQGVQHAQAYVDSFKNGLRQYDISNDVKALMNKNVTNFSSKDTFNLFGERTKFIKQGDLKVINEYDKAFIKLSETMRKAGIEQNFIAQEYIKANKEYIKSGGDITRLTEIMSVKQMENTAKAIENDMAKRQVVQGLMALGTVLSTAGFAYQSLTNDTESNIGVMSEWAIKAGTVISAIGQVGTAMRELITIAKELNLVLGIQNLLKLGSTHPYIMGAIGIGIAGYGMYKLHEKIQEDSNTFKMWRDVESKTAKYTNNLVYNDNPNAEDTVSQTESMLRQAQIDREKSFVNVSDLKNAFPIGGSDTKGTDKLKRLQQQADDAKRSYDELISSIKVANAGLDTHADEYIKKNAEIDKQVQKWTDSFEKLKDKRTFSETEETTIKNLIANYKQLAEAENERNKKKAEYANELQRINNLQTIGTITDREASVMRITTLKQEIAHLQESIKDYEGNAKERLRIETEIAQKTKEIREAELNDGTVHWDRVIEHIRNTSYNLTETINSGISGMFDSIANFGQNLLTESKSIADRFKDLFKNLVNDLLNMMMKVIMRGLIMNAILGIGNKNGNGNKPLTNSFGQTVGTMGAFEGRAKGGLASGWTIVGEQGPELVNFSSPGRVYTAQQTRNALSGNGGNVNIKIDLRNESGQQLQAEQTGSTFDGESYVVGVVLKAIQTNKGGMRTMMKGLANA